jgi:hypothetical protein
VTGAGRNTRSMHHGFAEFGGVQADRVSEPQARRFGRKPFGYFMDERETILKMRSLREKGVGFDRIAAALNDEGIRTRSGKEWHGVVVNRILSGRGAIIPTKPACE